MDRRHVAIREIGERVDEVLVRAEREAAAIKAQAEQEARRHELLAQQEADRLMRRRAESLRETRDSIRERSDQVEALLRRYAEGLRSGAERVLWASAAEDHSRDSGPSGSAMGENFRSPGAVQPVTRVPNMVSR